MAQEAKFWLTTHYPHPSDGSVPWYLYLKSKYRGDDRDVAAGDAVAFYESKRAGPGASSKGHGGIVAIAEVGAAWRRRRSRVQDDEWDLEAVCVHHQHNGFVARPDLCEIMDWKPAYSLRGVGGGSGLRKITPEQFKAISTSFSRGG